MNEELTKALQNKNLSSVRLVLDKGAGDGKTPPEVNIVSLNDALKTAEEHNLDLIGININQDPPVIKAVNYKKLMYDQKKKQKKAKAASSLDESSEGIGKKPKEWSFKTGIDPNDLRRKLTSVVEYLKKGYQCNITIQTKGRHRYSDGGGKNEVDSIVDAINEYCVDYVSNKDLKPTSREGSNNKNLRLQPKRSKK